ncbi:MAG: pyruvate ferredoxin oxidoreductase subunit gamma [Desulfovibrionaceae bacterium]|jgi:pyruvate ferredoxin oxidoreductase gamma subunit|uniref:pyruvate ferredoxin oxidoreductase subunit gamma n=1 Tax=Desulfovibrio TaxID=872 RepID=UPI00040B97CC|nr:MULTISPECIES: pyruvate ferredoxin oxidoreductase subunit gamma [Desulfovibrio]MDY0306585.1 pyruvate ferredoxin oxidoreductase subunit gamma [Desulfovibrionaceae bacterium]HMM37138.1 pyruvate ferredoxin oxidoreductase subunit gamma [Desulfovibrio sp.]
MIEIRIHGRGGQGGVTSAELLARAAIADGRFAQAFPSFGPERRGAPVQAFVRVDGKKIRLREKIYEPDLVLVLDPTLLDIVDVAEGLKEGGMVVVNSAQPAEELKRKYGWPKAACVDAGKVALEELGVPITNTTMLGALLKASGLLDVDGMREVIDERFGPKLGPKNYKALERAFRETAVA